MEQRKTIDREDLLVTKRIDLERLAKFVKLRVDPNWDDETLARKLFWEVNPIPPASMY